MGFPPQFYVCTTLLTTFGSETFFFSRLFRYTCTVWAVLATSFIYIAAVPFFGAVATREELQNNTFLAIDLGFPVPELVAVGVIMSSFGASIQTMNATPGLLVAVANDEVIPLLNFFKTSAFQNSRALVFTFIVALGCVLAADLNAVSAAVSVIFLICYAGVNFAAYLLDLQVFKWLYQ